MYRQLQNILVPIDFSAGSQSAISRAVTIASNCSQQITIHLVYHRRNTGHQWLHSIATCFGVRDNRRDSLKARQRLEHIKQDIATQTRDTHIVCWNGTGFSSQDNIVGKIKALKPDIVIVGTSSQATAFHPDGSILPSKVVQQTGVPVLSVKSESSHTEINTVVIPITRSIPIRKLQMLEALRVKASSQIRLVLFSDDQVDVTKRHLLHTFQTLKTFLSHPVKYEILDGTDRGTALLQYCLKVQADMLIVYPGSETKMQRWKKNHISDQVPYGFQTQILAVNPE